MSAEVKAVYEEIINIIKEGRAVDMSIPLHFVQSEEKLTKFKELVSIALLAEADDDPRVVHLDALLGAFVRNTFFQEHAELALLRYQVACIKNS